MQKGSPFVSITPMWRAAIVTYVLIYEILMWALSILFYGDPQPLSEARFLTHSAYQILLLLPILLYRESYGWLHPLILPVVYQIATGVARNPQALLEPLLLLEQPIYEELRHLELQHWSSRALAETVLKGHLLSVLALVSYYTGFFFLPKAPVPKLRVSEPRAMFTKTIIFVIVGLLFFGFLVSLSGGIMSHFGAFGRGRFKALEGSGHIVAQIQVGLIALMTWYSYRRQVLRRPVFQGLLVLTLLVLFLTNGSRAGVIYGLMYFLLLWMLHDRRVPLLRGAALALVALVLFGTLGLLRSSTFTGRGAVDTAVVTEFDLQRTIRSARDEVEERRLTFGHRVVVAQVPSRADYLYGESYLGVIFFWLPRAIWPDKPRGAGALYSERILGFEYGATSIPIGAVAEAYWNFSYPGVVIAFLLFGGFHKWLALIFLAYYRRLPGLWPAYILTVTGLQPGSDNTVGTIQQLFLCAIVLLVFGVFSRRRRRRPVLR